ncbi:MAG: AsmA family protein, partial [Alphaproteobacteria bacterium]|nr:AsmA family protein [Alphaproteobacteria bacterium]
MASGRFSRFPPDGGPSGTEGLYIGVKDRRGCGSTESRVKRVLIGIAAGAGLLLAAALAVPALMDWSGYRDRIAGQIEAVTGRDASVGGDIGFALLPRPAFSTGAVRIASVSGAASPDLVAAPAATLDVAFFPLLQGKLRVTRVLLQEPRISLEVTPGGRRNWVFAEADKARRQGRAKGTRLAIRALSARDATVSYRERGRRPVTVSHLDFDVRAESARGPFYARGRTVLRDVPLRFALQVDRLDPQPVSFDLMVKADGHTSLHYRGRGAAKTGVEGRLALGSRDAGVLARLAGLSQEGALAGRKVSIDGDLAVAPERVDARRIDLSLGDISASGEASLSLKGRPALSVRLKAGRLDLDPLIENWPKPEPPAGGQTADGVSPGREEGPGLDLAVDLAADTVVLRKQPIRQVRLRASLDGGRLSVPSLAAVLPGETQVHFTGDADDETPTTLSGRLSVASAHPRALLAWAGLDPGPVPEGRFARLSIDSQVSGDASLIKFDRIALTLDDTAVDGWFQVRPGGAIDGDLRADRLDLDAYRAPDGAPGRPFDWKRLAFLGRLQGELRLAVERLTVGGLRFSGATADLAFADGVMSVRRAGAEGRDGGIVALSGTVREFGRIPLWDLEGHIKAARLGDLVEPAGAGAAPALFDSPVTLEAASRGNAGTATLSAKGVVGPTRVSLDGDSKSWGTADRELALRVEASSDSWDAVARQLGLEHRRPLDGRDSPVTLKGTLAAKGDKV